jgi:type II secretory pathway component PulM
MARTHEQVQAEAQRAALQLAQVRHRYLRDERALCTILDELDEEIKALRAAEAKQTPAAMLARIEALESAAKAKETDQ